MLTKTIKSFSELKVGNIFEIKQRPNSTFMRVMNINDLYNLYAVEAETFLVYKMISIEPDIEPEDILVYPNAKMDLRFVAS